MLKHIIAALVLLVGLPIAGETVTATATAPRYIQCDEKDADTALTIVLKFPGTKRARQERIFLRATRPEDDGTVRAISRIESGCGPGVSGTYSMQPCVKEDSVEVTVSRTSHTGTAHAALELTISIPLLTDQKEEIDGIAYTAAWAKKKTRPNPESCVPRSRHTTLVETQRVVCREAGTRLLLNKPGVNRRRRASRRRTDESARERLRSMRFVFSACSVRCKRRRGFGR